MYRGRHKGYLHEAKATAENSSPGAIGEHDMSFLGSLVGAAGSVIGSFLSKPKTISPGKALKSTVKSARRLGIHPLAALGSNAGYQVVTNPVGAGIAAGAQQVGEAISEKQRKGEIDPVTESQVEVNKAQADLLKAQTLTVVKEVAANTVGGTTGARNVSNPQQPPSTPGPTYNAPGKAPGDDFIPFGTKGARIPHPDKPAEFEGWITGEALDGNAEPALRKVARDNNINFEWFWSIVGEAAREAGHGLNKHHTRNNVQFAHWLARNIGSLLKKAEKRKSHKMPRTNFGPSP